MKFEEVKARIKEEVDKALSEEINAKWLREVLLEKKFSRGPNEKAGATLVDDFRYDVWDKLSKEQQVQVVNAANKLLGEDLYKEVPFGEWWYWKNLVELVCFVEGKIPHSINSHVLLEWREENYPNFINDSTKEVFNRMIEFTFLPKEYNKHLLDKISTRHYPRITRKGKTVSFWDNQWEFVRNIYDEKYKKEKILKEIESMNILLREEITTDIKNKDRYFENLLESCCYIEKYAPGYIDKQKVLEWYNSGYTGVNFDDETKTKLNKLIKETFLKA